MPAAIYLDDSPPGFMASLNKIASGDWVELHVCAECGQLWRIDAYDKLQTRLAIKVPATTDWEALDSRPLELDLLVRSRGGLSSAKCLHAGCTRAALNGVAYCAEHLYATGARR